MPQQSLADDLKAQYEFDYNQCKELYSYWGLGKRIVESIIDISLSVNRDIIVGDAPDEVVNRFKKVENSLHITRAIKEFLCLVRVYGSAVMYVASKKPNDDYKNLSHSDYNFDIKFKALDPYNVRTTISQDPLSFDFLEASNIVINGKVLGKKRGLMMFNGSPLFIQFNKSNLNFGGRSVFANMGRLIRTWNALFHALRAIAIKSGAIFIENSENSMLDPTGFEVAQMSAQLIQQMETGNVAMLNAGQTPHLFNLQGANEISVMIGEVKEALAMALNDTPSAVLLDKDLSNGLSNGSEDMRNVIIKVNSFREEYLKPVYEFVDKHLFYKAWDDDFINKMRSKGDYEGLSNFEIRLKWIEDFSYSWKSIYPKTPDEETKSKNDSVDTLAKIRDLGADSEDIEDALNGLELFNTKFKLSDKYAPIDEVEEFI